MTAFGDIFLIVGFSSLGGIGQRYMIRKGTVSVTVERLSTDPEINVAVIVRESSYEVPDDDDDCWHCIFENEPCQKHMFLKRIDFNHNFFVIEPAAIYEQHSIGCFPTG
ncbi:hypothetical protein TNCV_4166631 [Trichonephila clavipes]|nr:hypothetical protein TNCV_4166631 [Trichonephila clavipes]